MAKGYKTVHDINERVKRAVGSSEKYAKGFSKAFLHAGGEYLKSVFPAPVAMYETNKELLSDTVKFLRNPVDSINRQVNRALETDDFKALKEFADATLEDLKSGKFYDENRHRRKDEFGIDDLIADFDDDFGGFDLSDFDDDGNWVDNDSSDDTKQDINAQLMVAKVRESGDNARTNTIIDAMGTSRSAQMKNDNANTQMTLRMSIKQHSEMMQAQQNLIQGQQATFQLITNSSEAMANLFKDAHTEVMGKFDKTIEILTKIQENTKPPKPEKKPYKEDESHFGLNGELDFKQYFKNVKKNIDEKFNISSALTIGTMGMSIGEITKLFIDNPIEALMQMAIGKLIPEKTRNQIERTNTNISGLLPAIYQKLVAKGKRYESGKSTELGDMLAGIFAPENRSNSTIRTNNDNYLKPAQITGKTIRAIEEVIPMWLARIDSHLSGEPMMIYDYKDGKLKNAGGVLAKNERDVKNLATNIDGYYDIIGRAEKYKFNNDKEKEKFLDFVYRYFQKAGEDNKFVNPYGSRKDFMEGFEDIPEESGYYERLVAILRNLNPEQSKVKGFAKSANLALNASIRDARASRDRNTYNTQENLENSGLLAAWSFIPDSERKKIAERIMGKHSMMKDEDIDKAYGYMPGLKSGPFGQTNKLLSDILGTLRQGIIVYSYNIGKIKNSTKLPEYVKDRSKALVGTLNQSIAPTPIVAADDEEIPATTGTFEDFLAEQADLNYDRKAEEKAKAEAEGNGPNRYEKGFAGLLKSTKDKYESTKLSKVIAGFKRVVERPFELINVGLQAVDNGIYKLVFGNKALTDGEDGSLDDEDDKSIFSVVQKIFMAQFAKATGFVEKMLGKLDDFLFDPTNGLLFKAKNFLADIFGINDLKNNIKNKTKEKIDAAKNWARDKFLGTKGENGEYSGGMFSGIANANAKGKDSLKAYVKGSIDRLLYGNYASTKGKGTSMDLDENGEIIAKNSYGGVIGGLRKGFDGLKDFLFGDDPDDPNGSHEKWKKVRGAFKEAAPNMAIGAGIGALASIFLPGGPVLGAILGSTAGLVKGSTELKKFLFGEFSDEEEDIIDPETGKVATDWKGNKKTRKKQTKSGIFSQELQDAVKQIAPGAGKGALIGMAANGLGLLPGTMSMGLVGVIGGLGGMIASSDNFKKMIFGDAEDPKSGLISKEFREKAMKTIKKVAPSALGGAAIGGGMAAAIGSLGIFPGLMLGPGGPIMAAVGAITMGSQADKINKFLFGEETEETVEVKDPKDPNKTITQTRKKRQGGIFGKAYDYARDHVLKPMADTMNKAVKGIGNWFKTDVLGPLGRSIEPLKEKLAEAGKSIKDSLSNIGNHIATGITRSLGILPEGDDMKSFWKKNVKGKLKNTVDKLFSALGKMIGNILSAPFKALEAVIRGGRDRSDDDEDEKKPGLFGRTRTTFDKWAAAGRKRRMARAGRNLERAGTDVGKHMMSIGDRAKRWITGMVEDGHVDERTAARMAEYNKTKGNIVATGGTTRVVDGMSIEVLNSMKPEDAIKRLRFKLASGGKLGADEQAWFTNYMKNKKGTKSKTRVSVASVEDAKVSKSDDTEAKKEKAKKDREAKSEERNRKKATKRAKDQHDYLRSISKYTKGIYSEIHGQLGGVGWNIAYIKTLLEKQMGPLKDEELPEEMEGSKKVSKKRGFFGKAKDAIGGFFGGIFDKVGEFGGKIKGGLGKIGRGVKGIFSIIFHPFQMLGKLVGFLFEQAKGLFSALWEGLKGGIKLLTDVVHTAAQTIIGAAKGIGEALGNAVSLFAGTVKDLALSATALIRGSIQFLADTVPALAADVIHFGVGLAKGVVKSGVKLGKKAWSGIKGIGRKIKARHDKKKGITTETKIKNIGTFQIDGGYLDTVGETFPMIGDKLTPTPIPVVEMFKGKAHGAIPKAIPVYIANDAINVIKRANQISDNKNGKLSSDYKNMYAEVDRAAESSGNPAEVYDKKMSKAKTQDQREAIRDAAQLNGLMLASGNGRNSSNNNEEEKDDSIVGSLLGLLGGGSGGATSWLGKIGAALAGTGLGKFVLGKLLPGASVGLSLGLNAIPGLLGISKAKEEGEYDRAANFSARTIAGTGLRAFRLSERSLEKAATKVPFSSKEARLLKKADIANKIGVGIAEGARNSVSKLGVWIRNAITKLFGESTIKNAIAKVGTSNSSLKEKILVAVTKNLDEWIAKVGKIGAEQLLKKANIILMVACAVVDFGKGYSRVDRYFDVDYSDATFGMKVTAGLANALSGLAFGLIPEEWLAKTIYNILASDEDKKELTENQEKLKIKVDNYNKENGTEYTVEEYQNKFKEDGSRRNPGLAQGLTNYINGKDWYGDDTRDNLKDATRNYAVSDTAKSTPGYNVRAFGGGRMKHFSQRDPRWNHGTDMAASGCGPTAAAMVGSAYGDNRSPLTANALSYGMGMRAGDGGTNPAFFGQYAGSNYGMTQGPNSSGMVARNLSKGQPVVLMGKGGAFGDGMHYMVADKMNGGSSVNLVDPYTGGSKSANLGRLMKNTSSTVYSFGRGPTNNASTQSNTASAQQALMDKLAGIQGQITYSTAPGAPQDPDKGNASCASMMNWAYRKVFPDVFEGKPMSSNAWDQTLDSRFKTIFVQTGGKTFDLSQFQPGDLLYFDSRTANGSIENNRMEHVDMYAGNGQIWYHGGGSSGNQMGPIMKPFNEWRYKNLMMVRRYIPFIDGSVKTYDDSEITYSNPNGSAGIYGSTSTGSSDSSSTDYGDTTLDKIFGVITSATTGLDNMWSNIFSGGSDGETSSGAAYDNTSTGSAGNIVSAALGGVNYNTSLTSGGDYKTNGKKIWQFFRDKGLTNNQTAAIVGNLWKESALRPENVSDYYNKQTGITDQQYTDMVDDGSYSNFANDEEGYGLAMWTHSAFKQPMYEMAKKHGKSIGDLGFQLDYLWDTLNGQWKKSTLDPILASDSLEDGAVTFMQNYEKPYGMDTDSKKNERIQGAREMLELFGTGRGRDMTNLNAMNGKVRNINTTMTKLAEFGRGESTAVAATNRIAEAIENSDFGKGPQDGTTAQMLELMTKTFGKMIELLSEIKDNTANISEVTNNSGSGDDSSYVRGDNYSTDMTGSAGNQNNYGKDIIDRLTKR